ncbi:MAG: hypothetical protein E7215_13360 [Clostridium sulfidigenes]|uniref:Uncharacterized protein n=1 Tax=Clostridium sulfidigenes TaxID=318464 RepID=A0A927WA84_9CLOT|nr:hypothetical protein [Clostridium sulfidigenes]
MAYHSVKSNSKNSENKLIGTSLTDKNEPIENIKPIQKFNNIEGCRVGVLAYCTMLTGIYGAQNLVDALICYTANYSSAQKSD